MNTSFNRVIIINESENKQNVTFFIIGKSVKKRKKKKEKYNNFFVTKKSGENVETIRANQSNEFWTNISYSSNRVRVYSVRNSSFNVF